MLKTNFVGAINKVFNVVGKNLNCFEKNKITLQLLEQAINFCCLKFLIYGKPNLFIHSILIKSCF